ncbi:O-methyltransferase [Candidatus Sororendozoicomonas aggregata]|uniref:O-methyltransferase n=1 Tax=Candidatus Sororendozoicomonas aggregata TaxID=3073239 RepID=UPI002ED4A785
MSNTTLPMTENLSRYLITTGTRESSYLKQLREETRHLEDHNMQIAPEQGQFMAMLVQLTNAKAIIEIGVFTGYSSLAMAEVLPKEGHIIACDINEKTTAMAKTYWEKAGVSERIDLRLAPGLETLQQLLDAGRQQSFDLVFIDADKPSYDGYYEKALALLRPGGVILLDNMLWGGQVADDSIQDECAEALRQLNKKIHQDNRVDMVLLPLADGITMIRKH